jgi:DNA polymerase-3 subunit delta
MPPSRPAYGYILAGPEIGKRDQFVRELTATCAKLDGEPPEYHRFYSTETNPDQVVGLLRNGSLFSKRKIVEFRGIEELTTKTAVKSFLEYLAAPSEMDILLLVTEAYTVAKPLETAIGAANKKIFWEMREGEKPLWLKDRLAKDGLSVDQEAIDSFFELVENESSAMEAACILLSACFPSGTRLDANAIEAALSKSRREDAFSLFDRMADYDLSTSLLVLDAVLSDRQSDPGQIVSALLWSFRKLHRLQDLVAAGNTQDDAFRIEKITSKTGQKKFRLAMRRYTAQDCARILLAISETESVLRSGYPAILGRCFLHILVRSIMQKKGGGLILSGWKEREYYLSD